MPLKQDSLPKTISSSLSKARECLQDEKFIRNVYGNYDYKIVTIQDAPFVFVEETFDIYGRKHYCYKGFLINLLQTLAEDLGFTYHLYTVPDNLYGSFDNDTNRWSGIMAELVEHQADMALSAMTITPKRESYVDFTHRYLDYSISLAMKNFPSEVDRFAILRPFSSGIWLSLALAFCIISVSLYFTNNHNLNDHKECGKIQKANRLNDHTLLGSFWFVYTGSVKQSSDMILLTMSSKVLTGIWWFFMLIVLALYTATLLAYLTVEHLKKPINNFEELIDEKNGHKYNFTYGTVIHTSYFDFLKERSEKEAIEFEIQNVSSTSKTSTSIEAEMFKNVKLHSVDSAEAGFRKLISQSENENFAFLFDTAAVTYHLLNDAACQITTMQETTFHKGYGLAVPQGEHLGSNHKDLRNSLNMKILEYQYSGLFDRFERIWWDYHTPHADNCRKIKTQASAKFHLEEFSGVYVILGIGVSVGVISAIVETSKGTNVIDHVKQAKNNTKGKDKAKNSDDELDETFNQEDEFKATELVYTRENDDLFIVVKDAYDGEDIAELENPENKNQTWKMTTKRKCQGYYKKQAKKNLSQKECYYKTRYTIVPKLAYNVKKCKVGVRCYRDEVFAHETFRKRK